jgi:hypothetical protein
MRRLEGTLPTFSTRRGRGGVLSLRDQTRTRTSYSLTCFLHKTNHEWVNSPPGTHLVLGQATGNMTSLDSPLPGLRGSHHLPPYSILCVTPRRLHPNGFLSQDSQSGVPKLSRFGLPGLWTVIASCLDLRSGRGLNQCCSSRRDLFNAISQSPSARQDQVDSRLLVVLILPITWAANVQMTHARPF